MTDALMRLNLIGFLSLTIVLISLFLPWWSVTYSGLYRYQDAEGSKNYYSALKVDYSAFLGNGMLFGVYENFTISPYSWDSSIFFTPQNLYWDISSPSFPHTLGYIFSILALSLGAIGCITVGSWGNQGRKMFLAMGLVFVCAIFFQVWYHAQEGNTQVLSVYAVSSQAYGVGILGTKQIIAENNIGVLSTYPNIGFYLAVAGVISALIAWRYPRWLHLPIENRVHKTKWIRWLEVSEREKLATLFLSSILMSYLLIFSTVFVF